MSSRYLAIKLMAIAYVCLIISIEIALAFIPYGPLGNRNWHSYIINVSNITKNSGKKPCIVCGNPSKGIIYGSRRGGTVVVTDYCEEHAPKYLDANKFGVKQKSSTEEAWSFGWLALIGTFFYALSGLRVFSATEKEVTNVRVLWSKYLGHPTASLVIYLVISFMFFWIFIFL